MKVSLRLSLLLLVATLVLIGDGFDLATIGYAGPELVKHWGIKREALTPAVTAGTVGLLLGAPLLSFVGDRFGRKVAILSGLVFFGLISLLTGLATTFTQRRPR